MLDTLINRINYLATENSKKLAVAFKKEQLTYKDLRQKIISIANSLVQLGIQKGDRVVFTALSKPEMVAAYLGIQYCGAIAVFADKNGTPESIAAIYKNADGKILLTEKPMKEYSDKCRVFSLKKMYTSHNTINNISYNIPDEDEIAELLFTTGTTGKPKGVMLSYKAIHQILLNTIEGIGIRENDRILIPLPLNHSFALRVLRAVLYKGATAVLQNGFTFAKEIEKNINLYKCTALIAVPASMETIQMQMQDKFTEIIGRFHYIEVGAGSLTVAQRKKLTKLLPNTVIFNTWGSSESGGALFLNVTEVASDPLKIEAVGKPLHCVQVKTVNAQGNTIISDKHHPGRMALKGDMLMSGYWKREDLTKETLKDGWLLTGDMVYADSDGYVYMLGRADDIINVGGEKVYPSEVETASCQYEGIRECACIGVEDPKDILGQVPVLFVVPKSNRYCEAELQKYLASRMERYKLPHKYVLIEKLPRNKMLKINKKQLRKIWENKDTIDILNPVIQVVLARRSIRKFTDQRIPESILEMILKTGYYAPSGHNLQSWRFTVIESQKNINRLKEVMKTTAKKNNIHFSGFENPTCVVLISNDSRNQTGCQDASCAAENIFLAAQSYGIGSTWLNALIKVRDKQPAKSLLDEFGIPENHTVWCTAALGYPVADSVTPAKKKDVVHFIDRE